MELKHAVIATKAIENLCTNLRKSPKSDLVDLSEISEQLRTDLDFLSNWINGNVIELHPVNLQSSPDVVDDNEDEDDDDDEYIVVESPEETQSTKKKASGGFEPWINYNSKAEWVKVYNPKCVVSSMGDCWDIANDRPFKTAFIDGDLRIITGPNIKTDAKRLAPIVSKAFKLGSTSDKEAVSRVIKYLDGDRRNLKIDNITWVPRPVVPPDERLLLIEDICRRIIDCKGDVKSIFALYENSRPSVSSETIISIRDKKLYKDISDLFFTNDKGKIIPRTDAKAPASAMVGGVDISQFFVMSGDKLITKQLIKDKINGGKPLSIEEKIIVVFMAMSEIGAVNTVTDTKKISNVIKHNFGCDISFDFIASIVNDYDSEIARKFREVK